MDTKDFYIRNFNISSSAADLGEQAEIMAKDAFKRTEEIAEFKRILADKNEIYQVIKKEMLEIKEKYSDKRRSEILGGEFNIDDEDLIPQEDIIITLNKK